MALYLNVICCIITQYETMADSENPNSAMSYFQLDTYTHTDNWNIGQINLSGATTPCISYKGNVNATIVRFTIWNCDRNHCRIFYFHIVKQFGRNMWSTIIVEWK